MNVFVRTPYNYDRMLASVESGLKCKPESKTVQSQKKDSDINVIVKRFGLTGQLPQVRRPPMIGDFTDAPLDYRGALERIKEAEDSFAAMSAAVRKRFKNDPVAFVEFCSDPKNLDEMRSMGLAVPKVDVSAVKAPEAKPTA